MKKLLLPIALLMGLNLAQAQQEVPNGGFENWTTNPFLGFEDPTNWGSLNILAAFAGAEASVTKSNDAKSGQFAAEIKTIAFDLQGEADTIGVLFTGGIDLLTQSLVLGYPYTKRPINAKFSYKFFPQPGEEDAGAQVLFSKNGEFIGGGEIFITNATSTYQDVELEIFFDDPFLMPDTAFVVFFSGTIPGSRLLVDDVNFTVQGSSVAEAVKVNAIPAFKVFPNPTADVINIEQEFVGTAQLTLVSMSGKMVMNTLVNQENKTVSLTHLPAGKYIANLYTSDNKYKQIISVVR